MTCTHAAITRKKLIELGFTYDSIVMEEAAQVLEIETVIPMLLQVSRPFARSFLNCVILKSLLSFIF
jgi:intron-binding protein aquarius